MSSLPRFLAAVSMASGKVAMFSKSVIFSHCSQWSAGLAAEGGVLTPSPIKTEWCVSPDCLLVPLLNSVFLVLCPILSWLFQVI